MRLKGKTAIITGAGSGFGEGIAKTFAREGPNVVANDLDRAAAERVASEIALAGGRAIAVAGDVSQLADWQALRAAALEDFGSVQIVVNNAGTTHRNKPVLDVTEAEFDRVHAVNVKSLYWSVQTFVPYFRERGGGANNALWTIAMVRMRSDPRTRAYVERRTKEGMSNKEIHRCLKRYIVRELYPLILADLADSARTT